MHSSILTRLDDSADCPFPMQFLLV
jgi:hypothetical protein